MNKKKGAPFGNKFRTNSSKLITLRSVAALEGIDHNSLAGRLKRRDITLDQYVAQVIRDYGEGFERKAALQALKNRIQRRVPLEEFLWDVLVEIYEQNPQLKSKRGKYNQLKE